jgi:hypothetical protein
MGGTIRTKFDAGGAGRFCNPIRAGISRHRDASPRDDGSVVPSGRGGECRRRARPTVGIAPTDPCQAGARPRRRLEPHG